MAEGTARTAPETADEDTLAPLRALLDPKAFREIVDLYETTVKNRAAALAAAARVPDFEAMRRNAHDLAGMCGQLGSSRASTIARRIEGACAEGPDGDALALVPELAPAVDETLAQLAGYER
jgi:HPt (histidine-containing phosphotransfer) domain-containing protein